MDSLKKILAFVNCIIYVLGIGCVGYLFYYDEPFFAVINITILTQAFPFVLSEWEYMKDGEA